MSVLGQSVVLPGAEYISMSTSVAGTSESVEKSLAEVQLENSEGDSTASTTTPSGSLSSSQEDMSSTKGLPAFTNEKMDVDAEPAKEGNETNVEQTEEKPVDGVVTRKMLEGYLDKLLKNMPLTTEETKYLCDRVREIGGILV